MAELRLEPRVWLQSPVVPPLPSHQDLANRYPQFTVHLYDSRGATLQITEGAYVLTGLCDVYACMTILFTLARQTCFSLVGSSHTICASHGGLGQWLPSSKDPRNTRCSMSQQAGHSSDFGLWYHGCQSCFCFTICAKCHNFLSFLNLSFLTFKVGEK